MIRYIRENQKKMMAIAGVILMIAFFIPSGSRQGGGSDRAIGTIGGTTVYAADVSTADEEWRMLQNSQQIVMLLGYELPTEIEQHRLLFFLLLTEAKQMGIQPDTDRLKSIEDEITSQMTPESQLPPQYFAALADANLIATMLDRVSATVKISRPELAHELATHGQQVSLQFVPFNADDYLPRTTQPTTREADDQYEKFKTLQPGIYSEADGNPFGFGYTHPNRIKYQYIEIVRADARAAAKAARLPVEWEALERRYYRNHLSEFPATAPTADATTRPATEPSLAGASTQPSTAPSLAATTIPTSAPSLAAALSDAAAAAAIAPTTRPFAAAQDEILTKLLDEATDQLVKDVSSRIGSTMTLDFNAYRAAQAAGSTVEPVSSVGVPYTSPDYLTLLAAQIQKDNGFLPTVVSRTGSWSTATELAAEKNISQAMYERPGTVPVRFADYLMAVTEAFIPADRPTSLKLSPFQSSAALADDSQNQFYARITQADPALLVPRDQSDAQVRADLQTVAAFQLAQADAEQLKTRSSTLGLDMPARASGHNVITTGLFTPSPDMTTMISGLTLKPASIALLVDRIGKLISSGEMTYTNKPVVVVDLYPDRIAAVVQVDQVHPDWTFPGPSFLSRKAQMGAELRQAAATQFRSQWCQYDRVVSRLNYKAKSDTN
jgi:hypothetical protein